MTSMRGSDLTIEVLGIGFPNKGAELMLAAIQDWAAARGGKARIVVRWDCLYATRLRYGLWTRVWHRNGSRFPVGRFIKYIPKGFRDRLGIVIEEEIDVFLDASGYGYGDPWGANTANERLGSRIAIWRSLGKPVILLPQTFGPFQDSAMKAEMAKILKHASLAYARDQNSLKALKSIDPGSSAIRRGQDFTGLVPGRPFDGMEAIRGAIGIIPNHKMEKSTGADAYVDYLTTVATSLTRSGHQVVLILHEGEKDRRICERIRTASGAAIPIIIREDPREIKMAIGCCSALLTSRFHGLASALFQGVPAIATSWSHKYEELAAEFGVAEYVLQQLDAPATIQLLETMTDPEKSAGLRERIATRSTRIKQEISAMWSDIENAIEGAKR